MAITALSRLIDNILLTEQYIKSQVRRLRRGTQIRKKKDSDLRYTRFLKKKALKEHKELNKDPKIEP